MAGVRACVKSLHAAERPSWRQESGKLLGVQVKSLQAAESLKFQREGSDELVDVRVQDLQVAELQELRRQGSEELMEFRSPSVSWCRNSSKSSSRVCADLAQELIGELVKELVQELLRDVGPERTRGLAREGTCN